MFRVNREGKSRLQWDKVQDSGIRTAFGTGSQRDTQEGKGRYDLIPTSMLHRLAQHYENGAVKYGDNNWQKGQPLHQYYNSAVRHLQAIRDADLSEDHFSAAIWNIVAMIHHIDAMIDGTLPIELDSFGIVQKVKEQETFEQIKEEYTPPTNVRVSFPSKWVPVVASGMKIDTFDPFTDTPTYDVPDGVKVVYDKDRFPERTKRTVKLEDLE